MTGMITLTQNDHSPELLAHLRRGPRAAVTDAEKYAHLLGRKDRHGGKPVVQKDPTAAVLRFQRRNLELKASFLRAYQATPIGISEDTFDRTEAQNRGALHAHIPRRAVHRAHHPPAAVADRGGTAAAV